MIVNEKSNKNYNNEGENIIKTTITKEKIM